MKKYIPIISMFVAFVAVNANAAPMTAQIRDLIQQKEEKIKKLEECEGKKKGWMIAGISTIGVTAVGVAGNIILANKSNELTTDIEAAKQKSKQGAGGAGASGSSGIKLLEIIGGIPGVDTKYDSSAMTFSVNYGDKGSITGKVQCSAQEGTNNEETEKWSNPTVNQTLSGGSGEYCYCQLTSYTSSDGFTRTLSAPWVFVFEYGDTDGCMKWCAEESAYFLKEYDSDSLAFRKAVFNSVK